MSEIVRALDGNHDWEYGAGKNSYKKDKEALSQNIKTRLLSFLGDCFFSLESGIDWFNILGAKDLTLVNLSVKSTILNTFGVTSINEVNVTLDPTTRELRLTYSVNTVYGEIIETQNILVEPQTGNFLLINDGSFLLTQDDGKFIL